MLGHLFLLTLSAVGLVSAQSRQPILGCTTNSFAIPSWFVQDLRFKGSTVSPASGNATFGLVNRATNYTANLACQIGATGWNSCSVQNATSANDTLFASIQIGPASAQVLVNQTWTCSDRPSAPSVTFAAVGNDSLSLACTKNAGPGQLCRSLGSPALIKGSLLSPVSVTPAYASGPLGHDVVGCTVPAHDPSWTLSLVYYVNQTGDGETATPSQSFILQVYNPDIGYQASCMGNPTAEDLRASPNSIRLTCAGYEFQLLGTNRYHIETIADFNPKTFTFAMNQTWYCDNTGPEKPVRIVATASEMLPLNCTSKGSEDTPDEVKTACGNDEDITLKGKILTQDTLAPYSIEDPIPVADGCTVSSILNPRWTFSAFEVDHDVVAAVTNDGSSTSVSFNLILQTSNPGLQFPNSIYQGAPVASNSTWFNCEIGPGESQGQQLWPSKCTFQYIPTTKELKLKADWVCNDLDPERPIIFSGITTTSVNSPLTCNTVNDVSECVTNDTGYSWTASISNVTWRQAAK